MASAIQSLSTASTASSAYTASQIASPLTASSLASQPEAVLSSADSVVTLGSTTASLDIYNAAGTLGTTATSTSTPDISPNKLSDEISAAQEASNIAKKLAAQDAALAASLAKLQAGNAAPISAQPTSTTAAPAPSPTEPSPASSASPALVLLAQTPASAGSTSPLDQLLSAGISQASTATVANSSPIGLAKSSTGATSSQNDPASPPGASALLPLAALSTAATTAESMTAARNTPVSSENAGVTSTNKRQAASRPALAHPPVSNSLLDAATRTATSSKQNSQAIAAGMASTADPLLAPVTTLASPPTLAATSQDGIATNNGASMSPLPAEPAEPLTRETAVTTLPGPATAASAVVTSIAPVKAGSTPEVASSPLNNLTLDSGKQAIATVTQNPAYANLIAGHYTSLAASSAQSPFLAAIPIRIEEITPTIAIPAVNSLSQLGAQSGREGNPGLAYRQRRAYFAQLTDRY
jgi:hypothetical protein